MVKQTKKCIECGKEFETYYENRKRCSRKCFESYWLREIRPKVEEKRKIASAKAQFKRKTGRILSCAFCKTDVYIQKNRIEKNNNICCSHRCASMFKKGRNISLQHKEKISKNNARFWLGKKRSRETVEKMRQATIKQLTEGRMPNKNTKIERIFKKSLKKYKIQFHEQKPFKLGIADFFLPKEDIYVFCDGDYWHNYPHGKERDSKQVQYLQKEGHKAYRFWERDILKHGDEAVCLLYK